MPANKYTDLPSEIVDSLILDTGTAADKSKHNDLLGKIIVPIALIALTLFHFSQLSFWAAHDSRPPTAAAALQLHIAQDYAEMEVFRHPGRLFGYEFRPSTIPIPPIYHLSVAALAGTDSFEKAGIRANAIFLGLLCIALWGIGKRLGGEWAGLAAAVIFSGIAEVQALAREQVPDLALASLVAAAYWAYLESERFSLKLPSILFGVLLGAAQLTKWSAFSYFLPILLFGASALGERRGRLGAGLALIIGMALAVPWYRANWPLLIPKLLDSAFNPVSSPPVFYYLGGISLSLELPLFLAGIAALASYRKLLATRDFLTHAGWLGLSLLFYSFIPAKDPRFILPALAPIVILVSGLQRKRLLWGLSIFQLLCVLNFGIGVIPRLEVSPPLLPVRMFRNMPASSNDWRIPEILREAQASASHGHNIGYLSVLGEDRFFNTATFDWERRKLGLDKVRIQWPSRNMGSFANFVVLKVLKKDVPDTITLKINPFGSTLAQARGSDEDPSQGAWFRQGYRALQRWILPDGTRGVMFWRRQLLADPFRERYAFFDYYKDNGLVVRGMGVNLGEWDSARGVHREVVVHAKSISFDGLKARDVHMVMEDLTLLPTGDQGK